MSEQTHEQEFEQEFQEDTHEEVVEDSHENLDSEVETTDNDDLSAEDRARMVGWRDDFDGPGGKTAEKFLEDRENDLRLANANIRQLESKIDRMSKFLSGAQKKAEEQGYQQALRDIRARKVQAAEENDSAAIQALDQEEDDLREEFARYQQEDTADEQPSGLPPEAQVRLQKIQRYQQRYPQVFDTQEQSEYWIRELRYSVATQQMDFDKALDKATRVTSRKFGLSKIPGPSDNNRGGGGGKKKGFAQLPADVKSDFRTFKDRNPDISEEEFAEVYWSEFDE